MYTRDKKVANLCIYQVELGFYSTGLGNHKTG